ncbi:PHB depolymerase family esterase [uncultured Corynebacterium sp.]|uniref:alpha/beta hydrolase family esterase n=1 Tax=uncultured Corynebacterium sp. TaxID=159447 RepID=UPI0025FF52FA|nr:PHB depolymerase family esterase [uncultured Corynebacterium sp.]
MRSSLTSSATTHSKTHSTAATHSGSGSFNPASRRSSRFRKATLSLAVALGLGMGTLAGPALDTVAGTEPATPQASAAPNLVSRLSAGFSGLAGSLSPRPANKYQTFNVKGKTRTAIVDVPAHSANRKKPILFMFGGLGVNAAATKSQSRLNAIAGKNAIIVHPQGIDNAWEGAPYSKTRRGEDVAFVREMVRSLSKRYNVDTHRVYAAGMSNGGGMAMNLACQAPDLVAGVVSVSGAYYDATMNDCSGRNVPTMLIHGAHDDVVRYGGGVRHGMHYYGARAAFDNAARRNSCNMRTLHGVRAHALTAGFTYDGCRASTVLWRAYAGGHNWNAFAPDAPKAAWHFLSRQRHL